MGHFNPDSIDPRGGAVRRKGGMSKDWTPKKRRSFDLLNLVIFGKCHVNKEVIIEGHIVVNFTVSKILNLFKPGRIIAC